MFLSFFILFQSYYLISFFINSICSFFSLSLFFHQKKELKVMRAEWNKNFFLYILAFIHFSNFIVFFFLVVFFLSSLFVVFLFFYFTPFILLLCSFSSFLFFTIIHSSNFFSFDHNSFSYFDLNFLFRFVLFILIHSFTFYFFSSTFFHFFARTFFFCFFLFDIIYSHKQLTFFYLFSSCFL